MNTTRAEAILKLSAYVAGVLYCCGALVTVVSLRRYGIYDLSLLNVAYIMRGVPFLVHLLLPLALPLAVANFGYHMYRSDLVKDSSSTSRNRPILVSIARTVFAEFLFAPVLFVLASLVLLAFRHPSTPSLFSLDTLRYLWLPYFTYRILFVPILLAAGIIHVIFGDYRAAGLLHAAARIGFGIILVAAGVVLYTQFYNDCLFSEIAPSLGGGAPILATATVSEPNESPNGMMHMQIRTLGRVRLIHETDESDYFLVGRDIVRVRRADVIQLRFGPDALSPATIHGSPGGTCGPAPGE